MLLEDDADLCDLIKDKLASRGYGVFAFNNYKDALQCLKSGQKFDIILIDLVDEEEGVVGHKVINLAKKMCAPITFVMSGSIDDDEIRNEDIDIFLGKPFSLKDLENSLARLKDVCYL
jgi:DNA-binding response OmpR family regulator